MINIKNKINGVSSYAFSRDKLHVMIQHDLFVYRNSGLEKIFSFDKQMQELQGGRDLSINDINGKGYLFNDNAVFAFDEFILTTFNGNSFVGIKGQHTIAKTIATNEEIWSVQDRSRRFIINESFLYRSLGVTNIQKLDLNTGRVVWEVDLNQLSSERGIADTGSISKFIGIMDDVLFVAFKKSIIIGLDLKLATVKMVFHELKGFSAGGYFENTFPTTETFALDSERKILFSMFNEFYIEINLVTNKSSFVSLKHSLHAYDMLGFKGGLGNAFDDKYIYSVCFMDKLKMKNDWLMMSLVAVNRAAFKIDGHYLFEQSVINTDVASLSEGQLYQLDSNKVLHVFEIDKAD